MASVFSFPLSYFCSIDLEEKSLIFSERALSSLTKSVNELFPSINVGDVVRLQHEENLFLFIWNGERLINLEEDPTGELNIPSFFRIWECPYYFSANHWLNKLSRNNYVHLSSYLSQELIDNVRYGTEVFDTRYSFHSHVRIDGNRKRYVVAIFQKAINDFKDNEKIYNKKNERIKKKEIRDIIKYMFKEKLRTKESSLWVHAYHEEFNYDPHPDRVYLML